MVTQKATSTKENTGADNKEMPIELLIREFDYARETASQAMEDRHKMVNFFLILTGAVFAGTINLLAKNNASIISEFHSRSIAAFLLIFLFLAGFFYVLKLAFLRVAWYDSALAMNQIKDYYCKDHPDFDKVFRWTKDSLQKKIKLNGFCTVFFLSAFLIILLNSVMLTAGLYILDFTTPLVLFLVMFIIIILQIVIYRLYIQNRKEKYDRQH